jgi:hypothetical protein
MHTNEKTACRTGHCKPDALENVGKSSDARSHR